jgi:putative membrane protein
VNDLTEALGPKETAAARRVIAALTVVVIAAVGVVLYAFPHRVTARVAGPDALATVNAALNAGATVCLVLGFVFIKQKQIARHRAAMTTAFVLSSVFLVTYLVHHARVGSVRFEGAGWVRSVYFAVLVPHVLLAVVIVPLALATLHRGWTMNVARHRSLARKTLPLWLYVSASGVLLYFMLYH